MTVDRRVAIVTGGFRGIGQAIVESLSAAGTHVVAVDIEKGSSQKQQDHGLKDRGEIAYLSADLSRREEVLRVVDRVVDKYGRVDLLVNNAGIGTQAPFLDTAVDLWEQMLAVNLTAPFLLGQEAAKAMKNHGGGTIVNIASISGERAGINRTAYGTTKAAIIMLTKQMAIELAAYNIRVNAISPGPIDTAMSRQTHTDAQRQAYLRQIPLGRYGNVEEISKVVLFLASVDAGFITGEVINVDGGFMAGGLLARG